MARERWPRPLVDTNDRVAIRVGLKSVTSVPVLPDDDLLMGYWPLDSIDRNLGTHGFYKYCDECFTIHVPEWVPITAADILVPEGEELLPFQISGINDLLRRKNVLLADEMGLGKTVQCLCAINILNARRPKLEDGTDSPLLKVLVIAPTSLKINWRREGEKWLTDKYEIEIAGGNLWMQSDFTVINYEALQRLDPIIFAHGWDIVIVDEAHYVKNPSAVRSKMVNKIPFNSRIWFLTGTPIVNYPFELFPLIHQLDKANWPSFGSFERRYCIGKKYGRNLPELNRKLHETIMTRRLKKDVLTELPKKRRQVIELDSAGYEELLMEESKIFEGKDKSMEKMLMDIVNSSSVAEGEMDFTALIESLKYDKRYFFEEMARIRHEVAVAKVPQVIEHLENVLDYMPGIESDSTNKIVLFAHHLDVMEKIRKHFPSISVVVKGGQSNEERDNAVQKFMTDPKCRLFIGGLKVAGVGLTLTAASHAVFAEIDWVPGVITQAEDRLHRIGQTADSILIQHMVMENSIDSKMIKTIIRKQKQIDQALNKGVSAG